MVSACFGFAIPINCLWHSQRSISKPNGMSHTSSCERTQMGHAVIQKPGKQFFIAYPATVFFPSGSLSTFRLVPRYIASIMASL